MITDFAHPAPEMIPQLRSLWKEAFGDTDEFLDLFFSTGFHKERCLCALAVEEPLAAVYWFDCTLRGEKVVYLYALATREQAQGQGIARQLLEKTHTLLKDRGCKATLLVPGNKGLAAWYQRLGYEFCGSTGEFSAAAAPEAARLRSLTAGEYAALRRQYLPEGSVMQDQAAMDFLAGQARLYAGDGCLLAVQTTLWDTIVIQEYLGDPAGAPGILAALGHPKAPFRTPGAGEPSVMFRPMGEPPILPPVYFAFPFD